MRRLTLTVVAVLLLATPATATPIVLTGGTIQSDTGTAVLVGEGFSFLGSAIATDGRIDPLVYCLPCFPGATLSVGGNLTGSAIPGVGAYQGTAYHTGDAMDLDALALEFSGETIVPTLGTPFVHVPFTLVGTLLLGEQVTAITGQGWASVWLLRQPIDGSAPAWSASRVHYDFALAPVPEPASLLLGLTGGVVVFLRRRWYVG